jgi:hypothetical protein
MDNKKMPDSFYDWLAECPVVCMRDDRLPDEMRGNCRLEDGRGYFFEYPVKEIL